MNFVQNFTEICSQGSNEQYSIIGSDMAIIWTNDGLFTDAYMHHSASMS